MIPARGQAPPEGQNTWEFSAASLPEAIAAYSLSQNDGASQADPSKEYNLLG